MKQVILKTIIDLKKKVNLVKVEFDKLLKVAEGIMEDLGLAEKQIDEDIINLEYDMELARYERMFQDVLDRNEDFMMEAADGNPTTASTETKKTIFHVMTALHDILVVQDQLDLPN